MTAFEASTFFLSKAASGWTPDRKRLENDHWVISGAKKWVSSGTGWEGKGADLLTVVCRTDLDATPESGISVIAVQGPAEGIVLDRAIDSIGHRAHLQPQFRLNDVRTPADHLIGPRGGGKANGRSSFLLWEPFTRSPSLG